MSGLKAEINNMLEKETKQIGEEKRVKLEEIKRKFAELNALSTNHINRGSRHKAALGGSSEGGADEKLLGDFERYSEQYEEQVKASNTEKQALREEISQLEHEIRKARDMLADKETENKNLNYLLDRESQLAEEKARYEEQALKILNDDMEFQLKAINSQSDKTGGIVTPLKMENALRAQYK